MVIEDPDRRPPIATSVHPDDPSNDGWAGRWRPPSFESNRPERRVETDVLTLGDGTVIPTTDGGAVPELDAAMRAELEALGYLEAKDSP